MYHCSNYLKSLGGTVWKTTCIGRVPFWDTNIGSFTCARLTQVLLYLAWSPENKIYVLDILTNHSFRSSFEF